MNGIIIGPGLGSGPCSAPLMPVAPTELSLPLKCNFGIRDVPNLATTKQHMVQLSNGSLQGPDVCSLSQR